MPTGYPGPQTAAEIITNAGILCGQFDVLLNETGNRFAESATAMYGSLVQAELGSNRWRFAQHAQAIATLTELEPPVSPWLYYWTFPADMLMFLSLQPMSLYTIWGNRLLTVSNQEMIVTYTRDMPVNLWGPAFKHYMTYALAEIMAQSVTSADKASKIEKGKLMWESRALFADSQSVPQRSIRVNPWIDVRFMGPYNNAWGGGG